MISLQISLVTSPILIIPALSRDLQIQDIASPSITPYLTITHSLFSLTFLMI